jgi:hypothetical protein
VHELLEIKARSKGLFPLLAYRYMNSGLAVINIESYKLKKQAVIDLS